jgi:hypothetical protein
MVGQAGVQQQIGTVVVTWAFPSRRGRPENSARVVGGRVRPQRKATSRIVVPLGSSGRRLGLDQVATWHWPVLQGPQEQRPESSASPVGEPGSCRP